MVLSKFRTHFTRTDRREEEGVDCLVNELSVNGEYKGAFRTKSYIEIWTKAQDYQLARKSLNRLGSSSSSSPPLPLRFHLCDYLLEPRQETLTNMTESSNLHPLLVDFFEATFAACNICEILLCSLHQVRANYRIIQRVINLTKRTRECQDDTRPSATKIPVPVSQYCPNRTILPRGDSCFLRSSSYLLVESTALRKEDRDFKDTESLACVEYTDAQCRAIFEGLSQFVMLKNPLLVISRAQFHELHDNHDYLLGTLKMTFRKLRRREKFIRYCKKTFGFSLAVSYGAVATALLVLAVHSMIGIVAAPLVIACSLGLAKKVKTLIKRGLKTRSLERRLAAQLEVTARGVFYLVNGFDMISRLVRMLEDEIEHIRDVSDVCVMNGKMEVVKEVVREFGIDRTSFLEQLDELEEQIFLCFLNINRSRMLVVQEIMDLQQEHR